MGQIQAIGKRHRESIRRVQFNRISQYQSIQTNSLMITWGRSGVADPTKPVLRLFEKMKKQWEDGDSFA